MNQKPMFELISWYLKSKIKLMFLFFTQFIIFLIVFLLYSIQLEAMIYAFVLIGLFTSIVAIIDFITFYNKHKSLYYLLDHIDTSIDALPRCTSLIESDYQALITKLFELNNNQLLQAELKQTDMIDYYTLWAHQIKTPIAAMQLLLQSESNELSSELMMQLRTVEQYVEMVLGYLRIESTSSDLNIRKYSLANIVKQAVRKYSNFFIRKKIKLDFKEDDCTVLTDEKWLLFVVEQVVFNALKYTRSGTISININPTDKILTISDTGIGIAEEDLPRIFEKGFTGYNGRMDKKATGIGLYLSKKILDELSHDIKINSKVGEGTTVQINLSFKETLMD